MQTADVIAFPTPAARRTRERRSSPFAGQITALDASADLISDLIIAMERFSWCEPGVGLAHFHDGPHRGRVGVRFVIRDQSALLTAGDARLMARIIADDCGGAAGAFGVVAELEEAADQADDQNARIDRGPLGFNRGEASSWGLFILLAFVVGLAVAVGAVTFPWTGA